VVSRHGQRGLPPLAGGGVRRRAALRRRCGRARGAVRADRKGLSPLEARRRVLVAACLERPRPRAVHDTSATCPERRVHDGADERRREERFRVGDTRGARLAEMRPEMQPRCAREKGRDVDQPPAADRSAPRRRWARCSLQAAAARLSCRRRLARLQVPVSRFGALHPGATHLRPAATLAATSLPPLRCALWPSARRPDAPSPPSERRLAAASRRGGGGRGARVHARVRAASGRCWRAQADSGGELGRGCRGGQGGCGLRGGGAGRLGLLPRP